MTNCCKR